MLNNILVICYSRKW